MTTLVRMNGKRLILHVGFSLGGCWLHREMAGEIGHDYKGYLEAFNAVMQRPAVKLLRSAFGDRLWTYAYAEEVPDARQETTPH